MNHFVFSRAGLKIVGLVALMVGLLVTTHVISPLNAFQIDDDPASETVQQPLDLSATAANCRYGAAYLGDSPGSQYWIPTLGAGWTANFSIYDPEIPATEFVFTVRLRQDKQSGQRLDSYTFALPLADSYVDWQGNTQPGLGYFIRRAPTGSIWLIGNEIEIDNDKQDNIMPDVYARAYREAYTYIKSVDPAARVAIGSVTMATPGRLQYLDIVWNTYRKLYGVDMPVDLWNFHLYILPERTPQPEPQYADGKIALGTNPSLAIFSSGNATVSCPKPGTPDTPANDPRPDVYCKAEHDSVRIFTEQVLAMRQWMKNHGQQDKELIISEFGSLFPFTNGQPDGSCTQRQDEFGRCMYPERVAKFLVGTTNVMADTKDPSVGYPRDGYRLIQRWLWYSIHTSYLVGGSSNLIVDNYMDFGPSSPNALTHVGEAFRDQAAADLTNNLTAVDASDVTIFVANPAANGDARLEVAIRNTGSNRLASPAAVTFYRDEALTQPIGTTVLQPGNAGIAGCNWDGIPNSVSFMWKKLGVGEHPYWVKVDSLNSFAEESEGDNVSSGTVTVFSETSFGYSVFLPVSRGE